jgi:hypothetical protein
MSTYLADKSALVHMKDMGVAAKLAALIMDGEIATCGIVDYDGDYDVIATVTGQPVEWVAPRGSL